MHNPLAVGLGEIVVSKDSADVLVGYGLGSCLAVGMFDPVTHVAGLLHAILPQCPNPLGPEGQTGKYVDCGILVLLDRVIRLGADRRRLVLRMAGGANMLVAPGFSQALNIGRRNVDAAYLALAAQRLVLQSQDVGGHVGRTVRFYVADGRMTIRTAGNQEREV